MDVLERTENTTDPVADVTAGITDAEPDLTEIEVKNPRIGRVRRLKEEAEREREAERQRARRIRQEQEYIDQMSLVVDEHLRNTKEEQKYNEEFEAHIRGEVYRMHGISADKLEGMTQYRRAWYQGAAFSLFFLSVLLYVLCGLLHGFGAEISLFMALYTALEGALLVHGQMRFRFTAILIRAVYLCLFPVMMAVFVCYELGFEEYSLLVPVCTAAAVVILLIGSASYFLYDPYRADRRNRKKANRYLRDMEKAAEKEVRLKEKAYGKQEKRKAAQKKREEKRTAKQAKREKKRQDRQTEREKRQQDRQTEREKRQQEKQAEHRKKTQERENGSAGTAEDTPDVPKRSVKERETVWLREHFIRKTDADDDQTDGAYYPESEEPPLAVESEEPPATSSEEPLAVESEGTPLASSEKSEAGESSEKSEAVESEEPPTTSSEEPLAGESEGTSLAGESEEPPGAERKSESEGKKDGEFFKSGIILDEKAGTGNGQEGCS